MYATCLTCHRSLGANVEIPDFPVGSRLAYDLQRGRLWVVCPHCTRWNLSPLEERWSAMEACERRFRRSPLRATTDNVGLAHLPSGLELIRIGPALRAEVAAWRYARRLHASRPAAALAPLAALAARVRLRLRADRVVDAVPRDNGERVLLRHRHLGGAELIRPSRGEPWSLIVRPESGPVVLRGPAGIRTAGRLLAALNGVGAHPELVRAAVQRLEEAGDPESYFARVTALALRTGWGRDPDVPPNLPFFPGDSSRTERLALHLTSRFFWARGSTGSDLRTPLATLPLVDRLALEMAAHEDSERSALLGELAELEAAWREAEQIAAIADSLLRVGSAGWPALRRWASSLAPAPGT